MARSVRDDAWQREREYTSAEFRQWSRPTDFTSVYPVVPVPRERIPDPDPEMRRLLELEPAEYIQPLRLLNRYWEITGDTGHIESYALDPNTYLRPSRVGTTRAILENALVEVRVGAGAAAIRYSSPMPPGSGTEGTLQEEVDLPN
jgi:hypothetical protein